MNSYEELIQKDLKYLWHPFTQMKEAEKSPPIIIERGEGVYIWDKNGNRYIDGISSWWVNTLGHSHPKLNQALINQAQKIEHVLLAGFTHESAILLAEKLVKFSAPQLKKVFYSDNGSTAVEVALKMAYQYWCQKGKPNKSGFIALKNSYHGDTLGAVSVGGVDLYHKVYKPLLFDVHQAVSPHCYRCPMGKEKNSCDIECLSSIEDILKNKADKIAGVIVEPLVQGAGGMIIYPAEYMTRLRKLCDDYELLLIDDEVAMGFGRTGKMFAYEHAQITPDLVCVAKGITGGYMPLSATITTDEIFNAFYDDYDKCKTFYHGHSYTGNPLATAVALEALTIMEEENIIEAIQPKIRHLEKELCKFEDIEYVGDIRQMGMVGALEIVKDRATKKYFPIEERIALKISQECLKRGAIVRPIENFVYFMPPLIITQEQITELIDITHEAIKAALGCEI